MTDAEILAAMLDRFDAAARSAGPRDVDLAIGARSVRLRFAGAALADRLVPALAHLVEPVRGAPDLTVHVWDTASTGVPMIPPPWPLDALGPGGRIPGAGRLSASFQLDNGLLQLVDAAAGLGVLWIDDAAELRRHEVAAPLRPLLAAFFAANGAGVTHAGAVGRAGRGGVLLGGPGGSGKSTTALLGLLAGLDYAGDDYVLVDPEARVVHSLYATAKLAPAGRARVAALAAAFADEPPEGEKAIAYFASRACRGFPIRALLLPRVGGGAETRVVSLDGAAALRRLAPSTILQHNGAPSATLAILRRLAAAVPSYALELGSDAAGVADALVRLVDGGAA